MIVFEYPLNERIRTLLRLEDLFERTSFFFARQDSHHHHVALVTMFEILEVASRAYILAEGQCVMSGLAADIGADPQLKRAYLGL